MLVYDRFFDRAVPSLDRGRPDYTLHLCVVHHLLTRVHLLNLSLCGLGRFRHRNITWSVAGEASACNWFIKSVIRPFTLNFMIAGIEVSWIPLASLSASARYTTNIRERLGIPIIRVVVSATRTSWSSFVPDQNSACPAQVEENAVCFDKD